MAASIQGAGLIQTFLQSTDTAKPKAEFIRKSGNWEIVGSSQRMRSLFYKTLSQTSLITEFGLNGYKDGSLLLAVRFRKPEFKEATQEETWKKSIKEYLGRNRVIIRDIDLTTNTVAFEKLDDMSKMLTLIANDNHLDQVEFNILDHIIKSGSSYTEVLQKPSFPMKAKL